MAMTDAAPSTCPTCGSDRVVPVVYGMPGFELGEAADRGELVLGGCLISEDNPDLACLSCDARWKSEGVSGEQTDLSPVVRTVVLQESRDGMDLLRRSVSLDAAGDLRIEGHDVGPSVDKFFGCREYEFFRTVRAVDLPRLRAALELPDAADLLDALVERYDGQGTFDLEKLIESAAIPSEFWSRIGD